MKPEETNISKIIDILEDYFGNPEELEDWTTIKMQEYFIEAAVKIDELYKTIQLNGKPMKTIEEIYKAYIGDGQMGVDFEKKHIIEAMEAYASQQTEKYKELIEAYEEFILNRMPSSIYWSDENDDMRGKIEQLKTELGL
jgi:hypothetical protein